MKPKTIDINVDVGEGLGNEQELMPYMSSCNIACGGHAGDFETMRTVVELAKKFKVKIGAHPSYPDKENFGRQVLEISCADLYTSLKRQIRNLLNILREEHETLNHIKLHGALYNKAVVDEKTAKVAIEVIKSIALPVKLYAPYNSVIANLAIKENIAIVYEAFADRNYNDDLTLVSRTSNNAIITDSEIAFQQIIKIISEEKVISINGVEVELKAHTFCVHGDHPNAVKFIKNLNGKLKANNILIL